MEQALVIIALLSSLITIYDFISKQVDRAILAQQKKTLNPA
jgi:hypothetical protein